MILMNLNIMKTVTIGISLIGKIKKKGLIKNDYKKSFFIKIYKNG